MKTLLAKTLLQYFDCLPLKINVLCRHSTRKMISASRRIFFGSTSNKSIQYFDCLALKINTLCRHSTRKMISAPRRTFLFCTSKKTLQYFDCLPLKINTFMSSFNNENYQCIKAHLFWFDPPHCYQLFSQYPPLLSIVQPKRPL